jgi:hypothetical protein
MKYMKQYCKTKTENDNIKQPTVYLCNDEYNVCIYLASISIIYNYIPLIILITVTHLSNPVNAHVGNFKYSMVFGKLKDNQVSKIEMWVIQRHQHIYEPRQDKTNIVGLRPTLLQV